MSDAERRERAARHSGDDRNRYERRSRYDDERISHRSRRDDDSARYDHRDRERSERSRSERPRRGDDDAAARHSRSDRHEHRERDLRRSRSPSERPSERPGASYAPNFAPSGLLAKESNSLNGVALKYHEPPEARRPATSWRLFVFKDGKEADMLVLGRQSCYLLGRDRTVADIPVEHPSCSKQHAVIQFRLITKRNEFGDEQRYVQPFLIDLESANGSTVNGEEVPASRYYELRSGDTCQFGASRREYVLLDEAAAPT